jgi:hypothetical protein
LVENPAVDLVVLVEVELKQRQRLHLGDRHRRRHVGTWRGWVAREDAAQDLCVLAPKPIVSTHCDRLTSNCIKNDRAHGRNLPLRYRDRAAI